MNSNIQSDSNRHARYAHPTFPYSQYVADEVARYEAAAKVTTEAMAITPDERTKTAADAKLLVDLYLDASRQSRSDRDAKADQLAKTPWHGGAYYIIGVAPEKSTRVKAKVKRAKSTRRAKPDIQSTPTGKQGEPESNLSDSALSDIEGTNKLAGLKKAAMKERLQTAFQKLKAKVAGADHEFYSLSYRFVLGKVSNRMYDAGECSETEQDVTNNILFEVSRNIDNIRDIYRYLCRAAWNQGSKTFTKNDVHRDNYQSLMVEVENENEEPEQVDNPALRGNVVYKRGGKWVFQEAPARFRRALPEFIQGVDLQICQYIREGHDYARIGEILLMTPNAVKKRVAAMRNKIEEMKADK